MAFGSAKRLLLTELVLIVLMHVPSILSYPSGGSENDDSEHQPFTSRFEEMKHVWKEKKCVFPSKTAYGDYGLLSSVEDFPLKACSFDVKTSSASITLMICNSLYEISKKFCNNLTPTQMKFLDPSSLDELMKKSSNLCADLKSKNPGLSFLKDPGTCDQCQNDVTLQPVCNLLFAAVLKYMEVLAADTGTARPGSPNASGPSGSAGGDAAVSAAGNGGSGVGQPGGRMGGSTTPGDNPASPIVGSPISPEGGSLTSTGEGNTAPLGGNTGGGNSASPAEGNPTSPRGSRPASPEDNPASPAGGNPASPGGNPASPAGGNPASPEANPASPGGGNPASPGGNPASSGGNPASPGGGNPASPGGGNPASPGGGNPASPEDNPPSLAGGNPPSLAGGNPASPGGNTASPGGNPASLGEGNPASPEGNPPSLAGGNPASPEGNPASPEGNPASPGGIPASPDGNPASPGGNPASPGGNPASAGSSPLSPEGNSAYLGGSPASPGGGKPTSLGGGSPGSSLSGIEGGNPSGVEVEGGIPSSLEEVGGRSPGNPQSQTASYPMKEQYERFPDLGDTVAKAKPPQDISLAQQSDHSMAVSDHNGGSGVIPLQQNTETHSTLSSSSSISSAQDEMNLDGIDTNWESDQALPPNLLDQRVVKKPEDRGPVVPPDGVQSLDNVMEYNFKEESASSGHFMAYFITAVILCVAGYVIYHNKQKVFAIALEGRRESQRRRASSGERGSSAKYSKLQPSVEEVVPALEQSTTSKNYIY
ncbi:uncharacterized protein LOC143279945 isoform X2 [Babylonia areolata]|uniref:uncharacterized protein LOC143279945 isoform X2 n=1 Tax=Babylonia areolata TaxID=304850 RepID=UPI003FCFECD3